MAYHSSRLSTAAAILTTTILATNATAQTEARSPRVIAAADTAGVIESDTLRDVTVTTSAVRHRLANTQAGAERIEMKELAALPVIFGERDVMKSIQLLPGVKSEGEGTSGYQVRGGTSAQNLVLVDNATIYNSGHLMGLFSSFNDDALASATLYKGNTPARLGGGASSVFDIATRQGDLFGHHFSAGIGLLAARAMAEGPISEGEASYLVAARRSYMDLFLKMTDKFSDTKLNFYDVNAKVAWRLGQSDNLSVSFLRSADQMGIMSSLSLEWANTAVSARWFHTFSPNAFLALTASASKYKSDAGMQFASNIYTLNGFTRHAHLHANLTLKPADAHRIQIGCQPMLISLRSAEWENPPAAREREQRSALQNDAWISDDWQATENLKVDFGLRANIFTVLGGAPYYEVTDDGEIAHKYMTTKGSNVKTRLNLEPRVNIALTLNPNISLRAAYSRTAQNIHTIRNSTTTSMPIDRMTMTSNITLPMLANQVSAGLTASTTARDYDLSFEAYYKGISNVYDYRDGKTWMTWIEMERLIKGGRGRSYGAELCLHKNAGPLTGWLSYTLSWSENKIDGINNSRWYTASNDRRHDISLVAIYKPADQWTISASWVFNTGQALTAPSAKYDVMGETHYYYAERNGYRAPAYHRLDISATHTKQLSSRIERTMSFGFYNTYNRRNPYMIYFANDDDKPTGSKAVKISLFGIVPSFSYAIKF